MKLYIYALLFFFFASLPCVPARAALVAEPETKEAFAVTDLAVAPSGAEFYAAFEDGAIRSFEAHTGLQKGNAVKMPAGVTSLSVTAMGAKLAVASKNLYLVDIKDGKISEVTGYSGVIKLVSADRAGEFAAASEGSRLIYFNLTGGRYIASYKTPGEITGLFTDELTGTVFTASTDGFVRAYSIAGGNLKGAVNANLGRLTGLTAAGADSIAVSGDTAAAVISKDLGGVKPLARHSSTVRAVAVTADGRFVLTGGDDADAAVWDMESGRAQSVNSPVSWEVTKVAVDPYFRYALVAHEKDGSGYIHLQYTKDKRQLRKIYAFRDGTLTLDDLGYAAGTGLFSKYLFYKNGSQLLEFSKVADIVHKPEKLAYSMPRPTVTGSVKAPVKPEVVDTEGPVIAVNERGFAPVKSEEIQSITGFITDASPIAWARADGRALILSAKGEFKLEFAAPKEGKVITISAADVHGNTTVKSITVAGAPPPILDASAPKKYALLIGINAYKNLPALSTPEYDARTLAELLKTRYGYDPTLLLGSRATRDAVLTEINRLRETLNDKDSLIVYYAGHGYLDGASGNAYWQPYDAGAGDDTRYILTGQITSNLAASKGQILVVADSCFSGVVTEERRATSALKAFISSGGDTPVPDISPMGGGHSLFASALIKAVEGGEEMSANTLFDKLKARLKDAPSTPQIKALSGNEFILTRN